jgi:hypothetical protein
VTSERESWRRAFEMIGPEQLRLRLEFRRSEYSGEYGQEAERWLSEKAAEAARIERERFAVIRSWAIIAGVAGIAAAIAGGIAAWPVFKGWF